jgi:class 3 adenylate cyclase/tetratricopeptide (TPR) repeat protein
MSEDDQTECPACGFRNLRDMRFCGECGARLPAPVSAIPEHRHLTILFSDLVDYTGLSSRLDLEDLKALTDAYRSIARDAIQGRGGDVRQFQGDAVMAYFGYPRASERSARDAVAAALSLVERVSRLKAGRENVRVRVGLHWGPVVVGGDNTLAVGQAPNVASRVQTVAAPNAVVISEAIYTLVRGFFVCEDLGPHLLKGVAGEVRLYRVLGETGARDRLDAAPLGGLSTFVGRVDEMAVLEKAWRRACDGGPSLVTIAGNAGVGKSRLVRGFLSAIGREEVLTLRGQCTPDLRHSALHPFVSILEHQLALADLPPAEKRVRLARALMSIEAAEPLSVALLAAVLSIPLDEHERIDTLPPQLRRERTLSSLVRWLAGLARNRAVVIVIEDLHWADPSTLDVIGLLIEKAGTARLLLLTTCRPDELDAPLPWPQHTSPLELQGLPFDDAAHLVVSAAGATRLAPDVVRAVVERSDGVPLFLEEVTRAVVEDGNHARVPASLKDSLTARMDRLGKSRAVAQMAATIGREFSASLLKTVSEAPESEVWSGLDDLMAAGLVYREGEPREGRFTFKHALVRDVAYESLLPSTRQRHHRSIAEALSAFPDMRVVRPELVAHHYTLSGMAEKAIPKWLAAGLGALQRAENLEAIAHLQKGLALIARSETMAPRERLEMELGFQQALGPAMMAIKGYASQESLNAHLRAEELARELGKPKVFDTLWGQWAFYFVAGELRAAHSLGQQVLQLSRASRNPVDLAPAHHAAGYAHCYRAEYAQAVALAEEGIARFDLAIEKSNVERFQFASTIALHNFASTALWVTGRTRAAIEHQERAMLLAAKLQHAPCWAFAHTSNTWLCQLRGDTAGLRKAATEVARLSSAGAFSFWPTVVRLFEAWATVEEGDPVAGARGLRQALADYRAIGGGILRTHVFALLADSLVKAGEPLEALRVLDEGLASAAATMERHFEPELHRLRGEILHANPDRRGEADESFRRALELARLQGARVFELRALTACVRAGKVENRAELAALCESLDPDLPDVRAARTLT